MTVDKFNVDSLFPNSHIKIGNFLYKELVDVYKSNREIIFICIGTDRCTGDSLGPLIGYKSKNHFKNLSQLNIFIYGTLESPIHSKNLIDIISKIKSTFKNPYIVAIDSCLGSINNIGKVFIDKAPIFPGLAVNKNLPPIGDLSITGIVNIASNYEFLILQNTRLFTVMSLADCITNGIFYFINRLMDSSDNILMN
ncbi:MULTISPECIES: spore protease YyaC [unclassified Clostridium]|jgi:putative sporulation protein yyaC|uniref:spore protease YyaC n=1 Tax=unclassified Clostridium TaxID=2614128 RepID=UPI0025C10878|nr:spore protease YyaC [Clostridium sp.]MCI6693590.1 spore protease YyaC [Clostridium sp.]MDY2630471.1 spore protease YyaC [Clostridium sp.]MDY4251919.1 spore protease YyaC [Clostridium sp.]MDY6228014.1 spore protease YyaC [Clostridium sp.]